MRRGMEVYEPQQVFVYENKGNSAVIWRCFSRDIRAEIPEQIDGLPVTSVAPYGFSAHMDEREIERGLASGKLKRYVPTLFQGQEEVPPLCGDRLEEISFPESMVHVGRYCFYNCSHLRRVEFYGKLADWGSGVFTGCHKVRELQVNTDPEGRSWLKDVLDELPEELQTEYYICNFYTKLTFPEFYEEGVENTPARLLETHIHGSGVRYRNCFKNRKFDFAQYDALFPHAKAQEPGEIVAQLVMNRLRFPYELSERARHSYEEYVWENGWILADLLMEQQDMEGIRWLLKTMEGKEGAPGENSQEEKDHCEPGKTAWMAAELVKYMIEQAAKRQQAELMSFLMDYQRVHTGSSRRKRKRLLL